MRLEVKDRLIETSRANHGILCAVAQLRSGKVEGAVGIIAHGSGKEVRILLSPDEGRELAGILMSCAFVAAGTQVPMLVAAAEELPKILR